MNKASICLPKEAVHGVSEAIKGVQQSPLETLDIPFLFVNVVLMLILHKSISPKTPQYLTETPLIFQEGSYRVLRGGTVDLRGISRYLMGFQRIARAFQSVPGGFREVP